MKNILIVIVFITMFLPLLSLGQQRWEAILGNPDADDFPTGILRTYDRGSIEYSTNNTLQKNFIFKTDINGNLLWHKVLKKSNGYLYISDIDENYDGLKACVGYSDGNALIFLLDECGNVLWCNQFENTQKFMQTQYTDVLFDNNYIITIGYFVYNDYKTSVFIFKFDFTGNLIDMNEIAKSYEDSLLVDVDPYYLNKIQNNYFISGFCYYKYPDNTRLAYLKAMFIDVDSSLTKKWFLPYGMQDSIYAFGNGVIQREGINYRGYGSYFVPPTADTLNSIFMDFDTAGNETGYIGISNSTISPEVKDNDLMNLIPLQDTAYLITAQVGNIPLTVNPIGEFVIDTGGSYVYHYQNHPGVYANLHPTTITNDNRFAFVARKQNTHKDILLYKLNADLSQAEIDTTTYVYDSLCNHSIVSDTIYLDDCDIVTAVPEFPTPSAYNAAKQKVELTAYPNPVSSSTVYFKLKYTKYHGNMQLTVYDISGRPMAKKPIATGQKEAQLSVAGFSPGMYVAVVSNGKKVLGKRVFAVE